MLGVSLGFLLIFLGKLYQLLFIKMEFFKSNFDLFHILTIFNSLGNVLDGFDFIWIQREYLGLRL
jgi:hypothetical protein